ncbi:hypothetical protein TBLA_0C00350 [Henningerozyma blattae CBS 6284]|uniref:DUF1640 domain-containing protein n=1 Tax=Henningerozyma blattae (strain ATCC 34711 / CBS 6284 / DSM 70876 / NBRC 10599 / NRRL Y-10934 / UCD 77-7) TaxID=1071380 RepID=I2H0E9_HENB6|nr:hypothetical protein TBLA_0C00350 [Tetrapisispora blattae CBS 6284]CCH59851.1 hypothetical protein TBLA_0C00350 [Tetrapisispora blattae CBS 6284]
MVAGIGIKLRNTSIKLSQLHYTNRRYFESTHLYDTIQIRKKLQQEFSLKQSETIIKIMIESIQGGVNHISKDLATRDKLTQLTYEQRVDFAKLRDQLLSADRSEFHNIQNEYERVRTDLEKLKNKLHEEITRVNASFKLDLSLEKGRIREESSYHDVKIKEIDNKIDQEVVNMKMQIDSVKTQVMQWLFGVCTGTFALILAYVRLIS